MKPNIVVMLVFDAPLCKQVCQDMPIHINLGWTPFVQPMYIINNMIMMMIYGCNVKLH